MSIPRPYFRTIRPFADGDYDSYPDYVLHRLFAKSPEHYTRAFLLIQKDIHNLFDYVEPADENLSCYSFRIHELLLRTCVEIEANCKAILVENGYVKNGDLNMSDYKRINVSHKLSTYKSRFPIWSGTHNVRTPFEAWATDSPLDWYQSYNRVKHDRHAEFTNATFENLTNAFCGLHVLLSSQFYTIEFTASDWTRGVESPAKDMLSGIGDYLWIKFPEDWSPEERYAFDWHSIEQEPNPFRSFDYSAVS